MKKLILVWLLLLITTLSFTQENEKETVENNELKINGLALIGGGIEVGYERILNEESSVGISYLQMFSDRDDDGDTYLLNWYLSPYYRFFFGKKRAAGFFFEGFGMLNSTNRSLGLDGANIDKKITDFALGVGIGGKWVTKGGFLGEINFGIGRNLFDNTGDTKIVGKGGIILGYRF